MFQDQKEDGRMMIMASSLTCMYVYFPSSLFHPPLHLTEPSVISPAVFVGVIGALLLVVGILVLTIVCVFAMLKKQKERNKALESGITI